MPDRTFWHSVMNTQFEPPTGTRIDDLTPELLDYLDSPDPVLRDEIAYETLTSWITGGRYSPEQLRHFADRWVANLAYGIGETDTVNIFRRSFSALMLSIIVYYDWKQPFMTEEEFSELLESALTYCHEERDVRGYDETLGWMHSPAHTADLLKFSVRNPKSDLDAHRRILDAVAAKVTDARRTVFTHSEYERLAWVPMEVLKRGSQVDWKAWLDLFAEVKRQDTGQQTVEYHAMYQNTKHFLRSVYFGVAYQQEVNPLDGGDALQNDIFHLLKLFRT